MLVVIAGPTASGKSDLAVRLAQKFGGEIISADSRQVYKGLDIGSAKITKTEMTGIPHHLLDVASPKRQFTVSQYKRRAIQAIASIMRRRKIPFLVGGSPFYIYSVVDGILIPEVKPQLQLRRKLEKLGVDELYRKLKELDPERANNIDEHNPRRLIRALEIVMSTGKPVPSLKRRAPHFNVLMLGIKRSPEELRSRIHARLLKRLKQGMIAEVERLHAIGLSWRRLEELGLEYRYVAQYLQKKLIKQEMMKQIQRGTEDLARRQMTWFNKDSRIHWVSSYSQASRLLRDYLQ